MNTKQEEYICPELEEAKKLADKLFDDWENLKTKLNKQQ